MSSPTPALSHADTLTDRTVPNADSASRTSRYFSRKPHIAGSEQDFLTAKELLRIFQNELNIQFPIEDPVFSAGSEASRQATLSTSNSADDKPRAWIDTYYPILNSPVESALEVLGDDGQVIWSADLFELADSDDDPDAANYASKIPAFHGYSHDGEVEGKLVLANYGRKGDYDDLKNKGVF